jgi:4'-phosphopantetheinyl transferase
MQVYWLEQAEADTPVEDNWLNSSEQLCLHGFRVPKRRADWRLGRWTGKRALTAYFNAPGCPDTLARIEIRPSASGAPEVFLADTPGAVTISLSHRSGRALCAVAQRAVKLGCDLEIVEPRSDAFIRDYFAAEEARVIKEAPDEDRARLAVLIWSGKESALKALHTGLRLDTRSVTVSFENASLDSKGWLALQARCSGNMVLHGWWQHAGNMIRTIVADQRLHYPVRLLVAPYCREASPCA